MLLSGRHGLEVKTLQGRHAKAIGERALSTRKEMREISWPYLSSSHCWSRCTFTISLFKMVSAEVFNNIHFRYLEQKHRDKEHSASRDRPIVRPVPVAAATEERGQRKKEKGLREMGAQWISDDQCADGKFSFGVKQTTTYESWQLFENAVGSMSWLRALGCTKMMVNERLVPRRLRFLIRYKPV